jgi:lipopolysaccharide export system permease protein
MIVPMKIIHRYTLREFTESFVFGMIIFSGILLLDQIFQLINLVLGKGVSILIVFKLFLLVLPNIFSLTIPMSVLFGILLSFGRLSEDNELTALRSTGFNYISFTYPILVSILILSSFLCFFNQYLAPKTHREFRVLYKAILAQRPLIKFEEKSIIPINEYRIYTERIDKAKNVLNGVSIYKFAPGNDAESAWRISATSATVAYNNSFVTFNLSTGFWSKPSVLVPNKLVLMHFSSYKFNIPLQEVSVSQTQSLKEMTGSQLTDEIRSARDNKVSSAFLKTEYWLRYTLALSPFIFGFIGIPLAIVIEKGAKAISFGLSLLVLFCYYLLLITSLNISEKGLIEPVIILWIPNFLCFIAGLYFWRKMSKR